MPETMNHLRLQPGSRVLLVGERNRFRGRRATVTYVMKDGVVALPLPAAAAEAETRPLFFGWGFVVELEAPPPPRPEPVW